MKVYKCRVSGLVDENGNELPSATVVESGRTTAKMEACALFGAFWNEDTQVEILESMEIDISLIRAKFEEQFPHLPNGGFYNPTVEDFDDGRVVFRCFYNDFDNEEDAWHWTYDQATGEFYSG